jgi:very-short-patch-repair endonuclease
VNLSLTRRRALRQASTDAEAAMWTHLRAKRFAGFKFRRQHPCGPYILDFYCAANRLAIELDGGQHFEIAAQRYDERRTAFLRERGISVLRFATDLVFREPIAVLEEIGRALGLFEDPSPRFAGRGDRIRTYSAAGSGSGPPWTSGIGIGAL